MEALLELEFYDDAAISLVTWMEVMTGVPPELRAIADEALKEAGLIVVPISDEIAIKTSSIRYEALHEAPKHRLKLPDAIILATANAQGRLLITRNTTDFHGPEIRVPYEVDAVGNVINVQRLD